MSLNTLFNQWSQKVPFTWRWVWAILISLVLHLLIVGGWQISLPNLDFSKQVIEAELALPPVKKQAVNKAPRKRVIKQQAVKSAEPARQGSGQVASVQASAQPVTEPMVENERPQYEEPKSLPPPDHVEIDFEVKRTGFGSGKARYRFQLEPQGRYSLRSEMEALGLASLAFSGKRIETSIGKVGEQGLQPEAYKYEISSKPQKFQYADFDWVNNKVTLTTAKNKETLDLPEGTQDFLSFMYQFMFVPPLDRMQHPLTNGKTLHSVDYLFVSEEEISTKLGKLNAMHIAKSSGDIDEKTELWLAIDYRYIPIKILKIAKDGSGYELTATRIDTDIGK